LVQAFAHYVATEHAAARAPGSARVPPRREHVRLGRSSLVPRRSNSPPGCPNLPRSLRRVGSTPKFHSSSAEASGPIGRTRTESPAYRPLGRTPHNYSSDKISYPSPCLGCPAGNPASVLPAYLLPLQVPLLRRTLARFRQTSRALFLLRTIEFSSEPANLPVTAATHASPPSWISGTKCSGSNAGCR
jgi:hypothetical protein